MESTCCQCSAPVRGLEFVKCNGFCQHLTHMKCIGWKRANLDFLTQNDNLLWFCNDCMKILDCVKTNGTVPAVQDVLAKKLDDSLKPILTELGEIKTSIVQAQLPSTVASTVWPNIKRPRAELNVTPTRKPTAVLRIGTKSSAPTAKTIATVPKPADKFWIYLSRIDPQVSEEDVAMLVQDCLILITVVAKKLVKKETDLTKLQFVSFKIGINPNLKDTAMDPSTWPAGIFFREFEDVRRSQVFRMPSTTKLPRIDPFTPSDARTPQSTQLSNTVAH
ncbi:uncharacterized protein LOC129772929 [Toxorhynchites rutilus septentrionalis]|uniref:uncharacterized protein LOC129772929 n=1 Tax=Toxorhynchites rutilus septentrionalis TaxID=329112 RepID=UPI0024793294|nr:uncharacterized protein LOC129772929 [Toxorhynchites rutilus septentrionalis]